MKVLATTDGSALSLAALGRLGSLISPQGVEVILLCVYPNPNGGVVGLAGPPFGVDYAEIVADLRTEFAGFLAQAAEILSAQGFEVRKELVEGDPATEILDRAERAGAELVVVASHGRSGLARFLLGSVSARIVTHAPCSVLVIKHAEKTPQGV